MRSRGPARSHSRPPPGTGMALAYQHRTSALAPWGLDTGGWWSSCLAAGSLGAAAPAWRPGRSSAHTAGHTASQHGLRADDGCPRRCPSCAKTLVVRRAQCVMRARGVVVSHPLSLREALGSIPSVSSIGQERRGRCAESVPLPAQAGYTNMPCEGQPRRLSIRRLPVPVVRGARACPPHHLSVLSRRSAGRGRRLCRFPSSSGQGRKHRRHQGRPSACNRDGCAPNRVLHGHVV